LSHRNYTEVDVFFRVSDRHLRRTTDLAELDGWLCWLWQCSISLQLLILIMLKKLFLSCLAAAIVLPLPLSVRAETSAPAIFPLSLAVSNKTLSNSDLSSIKKEVAGLIKAMNARDTKKYIGYYAKKYEADRGGVKVDYNNILTYAKTSIDLLKAFGIKIDSQDVRIAGVGNNKATVEIIYKIDLSKDSPLASTRANVKKDQPNGLFMTMEKINGRWLITSDENLIVNESPIATNGQKPGNDQKPAMAITAQDQQFFTSFFNRHLDALNRKNINDYLATLDASSPQYKKIKEETVQLFKEYTLKYTVQSVKLVSRDKNEAVVEMVATVKKISGGGFKDSKMKTTNFLKKSNGKWYISDTSIDSVTELVAKK
jgi:ketosteroid isomerase-like protein